MLVKVSSNDIRSSDAKGKIFSSGTADFRPKSSTDLLLVLGDQHGSVMQQKGNSCRNALGMHQGDVATTTISEYSVQGKLLLAIKSVTQLY